jgi:hypothetical protein
VRTSPGRLAMSITATIKLRMKRSASASNRSSSSLFSNRRDSGISFPLERGYVPHAKRGLLEQGGRR